MLNRREALRTIGLGAAAGAVAGGVVAASPALAHQIDPAFGAIEEHRDAYQAFSDFPDSDDPAFEPIVKREMNTMKALCRLVPTTIAGVAAVAGYIGRHELTPDEDDLHEALLSLAVAAEGLAHDQRRAA